MKITLTAEEVLSEGVLEAVQALAELCLASKVREVEDQAGEQPADDPTAEAAATPKKRTTKKKEAAPAMDQQEALTHAREFRAKHGQKAATAIIRKYGAAWDAVKPEDYAALVADMVAYDKEQGGDDDTGDADDPLAV